MIDNGNIKSVWKESHLFWGVLGFSFLLLFVIFFDGLKDMARVWEVKEEYGHGFILPVITILLILQNKDKLEQIQFTGSWPGVLISIIGLFLFFAGTVSSIYSLIQYAFVVVVFGIVLSFVGSKAIRLILAPLIFLVFMVPLPSFVFQSLSANLQLLSSELGVAVIRLFDISVYLEGNVIDLGTLKLQVVEACSGLRYLFPLMSLSFLAAYLFKSEMWKRIIIFLSSIPVTIFMNSFRIGVIGILVEYGGKEQAEGFIHDFEGWIIFMACMAILLFEMWLLTKIGTNKRPLREVFGLEYPAPTPKDAEVNYRQVPRQSIAVIIVLLITLVASVTIEDREEVSMDRKDFTHFPMVFGDWLGKKGSIEQIYLDALKLDDYIMADYSNNNWQINFYVAYYKSQSKGEAAHSPRTCIPAGGWLIDSLTEKNANIDLVSGKPLYVNRLVIKKGDHAQLVYYWFEQRGRTITNEYLVKWYLFLDAITRNRTDGALVRLTTVVKSGEDMEEADNRIHSFLKEMYPTLKDYVPE